MNEGRNLLLYDLAGIGKEFAGPGEKLVILKEVTLRIEQGDTLAVLGASGSGKSTLLHILGTLDRQSWGEIGFMGRDLSGLNERDRAELRNRSIGFVFQFHHLLPEFSALENVAMPAMIGGMDKREAFEKAAVSLDLTGLTHRAEHKVTTLSGGERQRAAIARAIILGPKVLLADEPTGNLDEQTGEKVAALLLELNRKLGTTLVVVTHNHELARKMSRRLELRSGELHAV